MTAKYHPIVGMKHRGTGDYLDSLPVGTPLRLEREPTNEHDPFAIKVMHGETHIGYVPSLLARKVAPDMDSRGQLAMDGSLVRAPAPQVEVLNVEEK